MKMSKMYIRTLREVPAEAVLPSHIYMLRAGMIRKLVSGVYGFMPLGSRVLKKVENIVREEMDHAEDRRFSCLRFSRPNSGRNPADGLLTALRCGD